MHPPPLRAHSATFIPSFRTDNFHSTSTDGHLLIFGGGDGPSYFNDLYLLNLSTLTWSKPSVFGHVPSARRAHTAVWYKKKNWVVLFGGGNGSRALNDTYILECSDWERLNWKKLDARGTKPRLRGYRELLCFQKADGLGNANDGRQSALDTMNLVDDTVLVFGGSDGVDCFSDVFVLDLGKSLREFPIMH